MLTLNYYLAKLARGTVLGLSYTVDDPAYHVTRALPVQQLTLVAVQGNMVVFLKIDGHQLRVDLYARLAYLRFGPAPYKPEENILPTARVAQMPARCSGCQLPCFELLITSK